MAPEAKLQVKNSKPIRDSYVGDKRNHLRDGYGVYKYENKYYKYEGQWNLGKKHGHGKLLMKDGSFYEGEFKDGEITGHGFKYWALSHNTYSGQFFMGELTGYGVMRYADGSIYEGQWVGNKREGQGKLTLHDGSIFEGEFYNHKLHGEGKHISSDGCLYEGGYINGKKHGHGVLKMTDGTVLDGQWSNDLFNGQGVMLHPSGFTYEGLWINGKPAKTSQKMQLVGGDSSGGITVARGDSFSLSVRMVDEDGELVQDNGREIKVSAGYMYSPVQQSSDNKSLFEALEDIEQNLMKTPWGYSVLPYPITDQPTKSSSQTDEANKSEEINAPNNDDTEEVSAYRSPSLRRTTDGICMFDSLYLLPPPPLYRPLKVGKESSSMSVDSSRSKQSSMSKRTVKGAGTQSMENFQIESDQKDIKSVKSEAMSGKELMVKSGTYVLIIEEVTNPPILGSHLPTLFATITVVKQKKSVTTVTSKGPKWDTSKHIASSVALHREQTFKKETSTISESSVSK